MNYQEKYLKYKNKYLQLKNIQLIGGVYGDTSVQISNDIMRKIILLKNKSKDEIDIIYTDFYKRRNGYYYQFGNKIIFYHPIIQYLDYWVGNPIRKNEIDTIAFRNINTLIENNIIDSVILLKQALYQLILNILFKNEKRQNLYNNFINFLIQTYPELENTYMNELCIIILDGFNPNKDMPNLAHIYNNDVTQERIKKKAFLILSNQSKNPYKVYLLLM